MTWGLIASEPFLPPKVKFVSDGKRCLCGGCKKEASRCVAQQAKQCNRQLIACKCGQGQSREYEKLKRHREWKRRRQQARPVFYTRDANPYTPSGAAHLCCPGPNQCCDCRH